MHSSTTFDILEEYQDDQGSILGDQAEELFVNELMTKAQLGLEGLVPVSQSILKDHLLLNHQVSKNSLFNQQEPIMPDIIVRLPLLLKKESEPTPEEGHVEEVNPVEGVNPVETEEIPGRRVLEDKNKCQ